MKTLAQAAREAANRLAEAGADSPRLSAELLLAHALGVTREHILLHHDHILSEAAAGSFEALVARREQGEPVAYLLGSREFYGLDFHVRPGVLIPRPETEHTVEAALAAMDELDASAGRAGLAGRADKVDQTGHAGRADKTDRINQAGNAGRAEQAGRAGRFADLGTGSGALAVTLAVSRPEWRGLALDRSPEALAVARENARRHGVEDRLLLLRADFTQALPARELDLIVANPPYLSEAELAEASREVRDFEPREALVAGPTGLEDLEALLPRAYAALRPGGRLFVELGWKQGPAALELASRAALGPWRGARIVKDYAGLDRVLAVEAV